VLEQKLSLDYEVSVVLARYQAGNMVCFPVGENVHRNGILDVSIVPARMGGCKAGDAQEIAELVASSLDYQGVLGVEFFVSRGLLYVNEMAPRPHNSGHYTIDACIACQYEQQLRVMCNLPLGDARAHSAAVMVNLLGDLWFESENSDTPREPDWSKLLAVPGLKLHLYGKESPRRGRKMGHFTVLDADPAKAQERAMAARAAIGIAEA
jgi:5-(carboxyamino)imidazole ribonucleotide synthase